MRFGRSWLTPDVLYAERSSEKFPAFQTTSNGVYFIAKSCR
ncbi:hypothetical protein NEISICOT_00927 [Neisseria sicca ATCC 29256]|uniref:Uncharacterized protein n=2 Tax=Neisseria TaxID=482 RepID=A0AA36UJI7_9NEIS|nr:hypothetical protein NEISICOT_00927 [Neisseria sicca ATCC 29256]EGQ76757.1 hypothetical protein HMPREF9418_1628 [Neisseria macacae ATCC 33926]KJJ22987.1 hypothetical protein HMPREF3156_00101 [Neisseria sp. HMSC06F02]